MADAIVSRTTNFMRTNTSSNISTNTNEAKSSLKYVLPVSLTITFAVITFSAAAFDAQDTVSSVQIVQTPAVDTSSATESYFQANEDQILWLARGIYSETKRPAEQELVAWVIRNRLDSQYRGRSSYRSIVLDPYQFSAFNPNSAKRRYYTTLAFGHKLAGWQEAIRIARRVIDTPAEDRPFSARTRHFYSERSMRRQQSPDWAKDQVPVALDDEWVVEDKRFRFYEGVL